MPTFDIFQNEHDFLDTINLQHGIDNFFFFFLHFDVTLLDFFVIDKNSVLEEFNFL